MFCKDLRYDVFKSTFESHGGVGGGRSRRHKAPRRYEHEDCAPLAEVAGWVRDWIFAGECAGWTQATLDNRRTLANNMLWFLRERCFAVPGTTPTSGKFSTPIPIEESLVDVSCLREFFAYLRSEDPRGKWGHEYPSGKPRFIKGVLERSVETYHNHLCSFWNWCVDERLIERSPMDRIILRRREREQVDPLSQDEVRMLLRSAGKGKFTSRDIAIVMLLLDTGLRASELCGLKMEDLDLHGRQLTVLGKGRKRRTVSFGRDTSRALWKYLREDVRDRNPQEGDEETVFRSHSGNRPGEPLTRSGLKQLIEGIGERAQLRNVRCSPHTLRHTFAIMWLRNGGDSFTLQRMLGHTSMTMTAAYVKIAQADIQTQARLHSPMDKMRA
jgi:site-specific recombinase XerD